MSFAIAVGGPRLGGQEEYQPVSDGSHEIRRMWARNRNYPRGSASDRVPVIEAALLAAREVGFDAHPTRGSASDWDPVIEAALLGIRNECGRVGWDGDDALPISDRTIDVVAKLTECLFTLLPRGTPAPDLIPEPDGEICLSWSVEADRMFSVSVGAHGKINFAGQFGAEGALHAWQPIDPKNRASFEESLQDVARYVGRLYAPPAVRRAA